MYHLKPRGKQALGQKVPEVRNDASLDEPHDVLNGFRHEGVGSRQVLLDRYANGKLVVHLHLRGSLRGREPDRYEVCARFERATTEDAVPAALKAIDDLNVALFGIGA